MRNFGSQPRPQDELDLHPPFYEPDNDRITMAFSFWGKDTRERVYMEQGFSINRFKFDHVPVRLLSVGAMRIFATKQIHTDAFDMCLKDRSGAKSLTEDIQVFWTCEKLQNIRQCMICVVMKSAIQCDVGELVEGSDGDDSLAGVSDYSDSDMEYEYDMGEGEDSADDWLDNVFANPVESSNLSSSRTNKGKENVTKGVGCAVDLDDEADFVNESDDDLNTARESDEKPSTD